MLYLLHTVAAISPVALEMLQKEVTIDMKCHVY